jgi:hypothetical protein
MAIYLEYMDKNRENIDIYEHSHPFIPFTGSHGLQISGLSYTDGKPQ